MSGKGQAISRRVHEKTSKGSQKKLKETYSMNQTTQDYLEDQCQESRMKKAILWTTAILFVALIW